ncbi:hypothetical protein PFICI_03641 [Pestalotiopsis fici W106-1]|uniref:FAD dependent oxidoreductase domain-containing protein n=1 Tax=Pestalotiopsis fici (strain W106-1 / CGMCC3.15140) TaxID=1229662 RepID=W3XK51_PESFW|nr:uncharacterized protein PFICI_03641 [Pestalotiopsis fici W106-1]ETS85616.1 hypothetical protein PFICI_03641 [Pestalotiopsis fici W106-1]
MTLPSKDDSLLIVGAGVFGLSLAYELTAVRGYTRVTVLDRHMPPVPDGSSNDLSRVVRAEYTDPLYSQLAIEAITEWRTTEWRDHYHESGYVMIIPNADSEWVTKYRALREKQAVQQPMNIFAPDASESAIKRMYPCITTDLNGITTLQNDHAGWAHAHGAIRALANRCTLAGVSFVTGPRGTVTSLETSGKQVLGVRTATGSIMKAKTVVLATGAWTNRLVSDMRQNILGVSQPLAYIQLSPKEAQSLEKMPVMVNTATGLYCFPPDPVSHQLKVARHGYGYSNQVKLEDGREISSPRLMGNNAAVQDFLPADADRDLREGAKAFWPQFGNRPWAKTRMCWYTDTPKSDFMVDYHPDMNGLFFATGGSGHGFKFLPVIGKHIADVFEDKAGPLFRERWAVRRPTDADSEPEMEGDGTRLGPRLRQLSKAEQAKL